MWILLALSCISSAYNNNNDVVIMYYGLERATLSDFLHSL